MGQATARKTIQYSQLDTVNSRIMNGVNLVAHRQGSDEATAAALLKSRDRVPCPRCQLEELITDSVQSGSVQFPLI